MSAKVVVTANTASTYNPVPFKWSILHVSGASR